MSGAQSAGVLRAKRGPRATQTANQNESHTSQHGDTKRASHTAKQQQEQDTHTQRACRPRHRRKHRAARTTLRFSGSSFAMISRSFSTVKSDAVCSGRTETNVGQHSPAQQTRNGLRTRDNEIDSSTQRPRHERCGKGESRHGSEAPTTVQPVAAASRVTSLSIAAARRTIKI